MTRRLLLGLFCALLPLAAQPNLRPLSILHTNDIHAHFLPDDRDLGGFARLASALETERAHCEACIYLNAGDLVQGTPVSTIFNGIPVYQIANHFGITAATVGNHEFDYGWRRVQEFAKIAAYPLLSANVVDEKGAPLTGKAYTVKTIGGIRVGIIGVVLGDLIGVYATPDKVLPWRVLPVVETVQKYAKELRDRTDIIIVVGHIHDQPEVEDILKKVPEVSVVIAGHNHTGYKEMMNFDGRVGVLLNGYGRELGRLDLKVDLAAKKAVSADWKRITIDSKITPRPAIQHEVDQWEAKVSKIVDVQIGEAKHRYEGNELRTLIERAMAAEAGTDLAFINHGNSRDVLPQGPILARAIWNILPFDNTVVIGTFKGSELPKTVTERNNIDPNRTYTMATSNFTATNQAAENELNASGLDFPKTTNRLQRDMVIEWIRKQKVLP